MWSVSVSLHLPGGGHSLCSVDSCYFCTCFVIVVVCLFLLTRQHLAVVYLLGLCPFCAEFVLAGCYHRNKTSIGVAAAGFKLWI